MRFAHAGLEELDFLPSASHWAISLSTAGVKEMKANCPVRTRCDSPVRSAGVKSVLLSALKGIRVNLRQERRKIHDNFFAASYRSSNISSTNS
ncbi:MAG: hypothetical protein QM496_16440, partial [Verrucomicrobiota bacterium]